MSTQRTTVWQRAVIAGMLGGCVLAAALPAAAQRWGRPRVPQAGACFYQDANYRGDYFCVTAGEDVQRMPSGLNDRISSIRTFGGVEVTVFRNPSFGGRSTRFDGDVSNLQQEGWNDTLSSLSVRRARGGWGGWGGRGGGANDGRGGGGRQSGFEAERIVRRAYQDTLHRDPDEAGMWEYSRRILDGGWSEGDVREALQRSPEFRQQQGRGDGGRFDGDRGQGGRGDSGMSRERAQEVVRRAYQSVLGREPDPASEGFVTRVLRDNWSEEDVARELRKSAEYRNRRPPPV